ncbi:aminotransferase class V-fold PLP-dependent enzyme [Candidatus Fermentibacteria bacterium]|nr:aminotransferase class V-fold PLP-dependent enzyme [Candidatus Fermentibacteria bacterium]
MNEKTRVYLDNLTATPMISEAREAVVQTLQNQVGSRYSSNSAGRATRDFLRSREDEIIAIVSGEACRFCSGGAEANRIAVLALGRSQRSAGKDHVVSTTLEDSSTLDSLRALAAEGSSVSLTGVAGDGRVEPAELESLIGPRTGLVSVSSASPVSGVLNPVDEISKICRDREVLLHCDAGCVAGRVKLDLSDPPVDVVSISSHLLGGPPGMGAVVCRGPKGCGLEAGPLPPSLPNLPGLAGMTAAMKEASRVLSARRSTVERLTEVVLAHLREKDVEFELFGRKVSRVPGAFLLDLGPEVREGLHARLDVSGMVVACHDSLARKSFLRSVFGEEVNPDSFVGGCFYCTNSIVDAELFARTLCDLL